MALNGWIPDEIVSEEIYNVYNRGSAVLRNVVAQDMDSHTDQIPVAGSGNVSVVTDETKVLADDSRTDGSVTVSASIFKEVVPMTSVDLQDAGPSRAAALDASMNSSRQAFGRVFDLASLTAGVLQATNKNPARKTALPYNSAGRVARLAGNHTAFNKTTAITKAAIDAAVEKVLSSTRVNVDALRWFMPPSLLADVAALTATTGGPYYIEPRTESSPATIAGFPVELTLGARGQTDLATNNVAADNADCLLLVDTSQMAVGRARIDEDMDGSSGFLVVPKMTTEISLQNRIVFLARYGAAIATDPVTASNTPVYVITKLR